MNVYVVRTCIQCGRNMYVDGTKMGGTKRRWYEKPGIRNNNNHDNNNINNNNNSNNNNN